jgi:hypothetical protein
MSAVARHRRLSALAWTLLVLLAAAARAEASTGRATFPVVGGTATSSTIQPGFLGLSMEFYAVHEYTGSDPGAIDPVLIQLIKNLSPGQSPVLRIGGDSTDQSWWPVAGVLPPRGIDYPLTPDWLRTTDALANVLGAKLIVGINMQLNRPALAAVEARALLAGLGESLEAFEIGNEPDLYGILPWYLTAGDKAKYGRPPSFDVSDYIQQFSNIRHALPAAPIAGPAFANLTWMQSGLSQFLSAESGLGVVTLHRYPLRSCGVPTSSPAYATIPNLLSDYSQSELAQGVAPYVAMAHAQGLPFRVDEMNSASCFGTAGVSDTFASALWVLDTLFEMANVGVDGVNIHTLPGSHYELFTTSHNGTSWQADVHPEYYGMLMFAQAAPAGSQLLPITGVPDGPLKVWATLAPDGTERIVLINEDASAAAPVVLQAPGTSASAELLTAASLDATDGVTLGAQSFGPETGTGSLPGPEQTSTVYSLLGTYSVTVPPASALLLTLH